MAINNKQILVTFNQEVDKESAETKSNYTLTEPTVSASNFDVKLQEDKKSVIIDLTTAKTAQAEQTIKVEDVKSADKSQELEAVTKTIQFFDTEIPAVTGDVEVIGPKTVRVYVSEPLQNLDKTKIRINNGTVGLDIGNTAFSTSADYSKNYVDVALVADMVAGTTYDIEFGAGALEDYAGATGYKNVKQTVSVNYEKVAEGVTASITEASQTSVKVEFSQAVDVSKVSEDLFYHSGVGTYKPADVTPTTAGATSKEFTLDFSNNPLPAGDVKLAIKAKDGSNEIVDVWGNKLSSETLELNFNVVADTAAPVVKEVEVVSPTQLTVEFDEAVNSTDAQNRLNYVFRNATTGEIVKVAPFDANGNSLNSPTYNNKVATFNFGTALAGGTYTVEVKNIRDVSLAQNKLAAQTVQFTVKDETAPAFVGDAELFDNGKVIVAHFTKELDRTTAENTANYQLSVDGTAKALPSGTTARLSADGKSVTITLPNTVTDLDGTTDALIIANIKDTTGNSVAFGTSADIKPSTGAAVASIDGNKGYFDTKDTVVIYLDKELTSVDGNKIQYNDGATDKSIAGVSFVNETGTINGDTYRAKLVVTLPNDAMTGTDGAGVASVKVLQDALTGVNGKKNSADTVLLSDFEDKLAPEVAKNADDEYLVEVKDVNDNGKIDTVEITFTEAIKQADVALTTFEVQGYSIENVTFGGTTSGSGATATATKVILTVTEKSTPDTQVTPTVTIKGTVRDAAGNVLATTGTLDSLDVAAAALTGVDLSDDKKVVTLSFSEAISNNTASAAALKSAITLSTDGSTFGALATEDSVEISGDKLIIRLDTALTTATNKVKIAADTLKDAAGNKTAEVTTEAIKAE